MPLSVIVRPEAGDNPSVWVTIFVNFMVILVPFSVHVKFRCLRVILGVQGYVSSQVWFFAPNCAKNEAKIRLIRPPECSFEKELTNR